MCILMDRENVSQMSMQIISEDIKLESISIMAPLKGVSTEKPSTWEYSQYYQVFWVSGIKEFYAYLPVLNMDNF